MVAVTFVFALPVAAGPWPHLLKPLARPVVRAGCGVGHLGGRQGDDHFAAHADFLLLPRAEALGLL